MTTSLAETGIPTWEAQQLAKLSAEGLLHGVPTLALASVAKNESGFEVAGPGINSSGYGGYFGLGAGSAYPGGTPSSSLLLTNSPASFDTQAEIASSLIAAGAAKAGGSVVEGVNYLNLGKTSGPLGADASIYEGYLGGKGPEQARGISTQMGGPGGNAATGAQSAGTVGGQSWALSLQNVLNPTSSGVLGTSSTIAEWGARLGLVAVGLILFLGGLAVIGVSCVSNDRRHADQMLSKVANWVEEDGGSGEALVTASQVELISL
jgi:hypothetical protein